MRNLSLPVNEKEKEILESIENYPVTIIEAETGSGKSTQVPQMLLEAEKTVIVTEPRRMAAMNLAQRISEEREESVGSGVGYQTGFEKCYSPQTKLTICTDGLQLVRGITNKEDVLIIDEVHEWNPNIEALVAWHKKQNMEHQKLVLMSATLEISQLSDYFGKENINHVRVKGKPYEVEWRYSKGAVEDRVAEYAKLGQNILVFLPGLEDIIRMKSILEKEKNLTDCMILPLHSNLSYMEQKKCFKKYNIPKIILATNIAQSSVTISDIDVIVDSGKEKRKEVRNGIEGIFIHHISKAACRQRAGRAGRCKNGIYELVSNVPYEAREEYDTPEIERSLLDKVVLRLAAANLDAEKLQFVHQPNLNEIRHSKKILEKLGAMENGNRITELGKKMVEMPVSARYARILVEAMNRFVLADLLS